MSVEERLYALASQARQQSGDALLRSPTQFVPRVTSQAPDLYGEARALAAALAGDAAARIAAAADPEAEARQVATEIAGAERLSMTVATPAVAVARRLGQLGGAAATMPPPPVASGWAGDSVIATPPAVHPPAPSPAYAPPVGYTAPAPSAAPTPAAEPIWKNKWAMGGAAAVALLLIYQMGQKPQTGQQAPPQAGQPQQQGPGAQGPGMQGQTPSQPGQMPGQAPQPGQMPPQGGQPGAGGMPMQPPGGSGGAAQGGPPLLQPPGGNLPTLAVQQGAGGAPIIFFQVQTRNGPAPAIIALPGGGWDSGAAMFGFSRPGNSGQPDTVGTAQFRAGNAQGSPVRTAVPAWQQDALGMGDICVGFMGAQPGQDVALRGATMCVMDGSCGQAAGCGKLP